VSAYYNEIDPYAVQWLKNLIAAGLIADGEVDNRSIEEVSPDDLKGFTQCHFFAGIGGWSLAARLAGWADDEPLWTGSCPCQPFSAACRPSAVAGEQVASKLGYEWLTGVRSDLESEGYAVGAVDLCAASVGAPHIRQRMWWVADPGCGGFRDQRLEVAGTPREVQEEVRQQWIRLDARNGGSIDSLADPDQFGQAREQAGRWEARSESDRGGFWMGRWINCADGKARRIEPSIEPLAHGVSARVGRLRAYGNAIVPQVAAEVLKAWRGNG
jgi:DNA (cytosine-5)-methyltransferase 1